MYDYEHFLQTESQRYYIHSLPKTLRAPDIELEVAAKDGSRKRYFIKKYADLDAGKTLWDIVIVQGDEVRDKLVMEDEEGMNFIADLARAR